MTYKTVKVEKGRGGWGIPLLITPVPGKDKISSITGGGIHPVAQKIAELSGGTAIDGFRHPVADGEVACAVIDCNFSFFLIDFAVNFRNFYHVSGFFL